MSRVQATECDSLPSTQGERHGQRRAKRQPRVQKAKKGQGQDNRRSTEPKGRGGGLATNVRIRQEEIEKRLASTVQLRAENAGLGSLLRGIGGGLDDNRAGAGARIAPGVRCDVVDGVGGELRGVDQNIPRENAVDEGAVREIVPLVVGDDRADVVVGVANLDCRWIVAQDADRRGSGRSGNRGRRRRADLNSRRARENPSKLVAIDADGRAIRFLDTELLRCEAACKSTKKPGQVTTGTGMAP
jgi:hypothetical protein